MFTVLYGDDLLDLHELRSFDDYDEAEACADLVRQRGFSIVFVKDVFGVSAKIERRCINVA